MEFLLNSKSQKFDMIIIDTVDSKRFSKFFVNLSQSLPTTLMNHYKNGIASELYSIKNSTYALPLYIEYNMLYSNQDLLNKYNLDIPKTWDELFDIAKLIVTEEKNLINEVIGYTADMTDSESGFASFYEFIYSFRNNLNDTFPEITSPEVVNAMKKLKEIKKEFGEFGLRSTNNEIKNCLNSDKCLFVKTKSNAQFTGNYTKSNIPGKIEGISGSCLGGYSLGINKFVSKEKKEVALKIMEFIGSYEFQSNVIMKSGLQSAYDSLYKNEVICQDYEQCKEFKSIQPIIRPINEAEDYTTYSQQFRNYLLKYLYNDEDLTKCLQGIQYLTKVIFEDYSAGINQLFTVMVAISDFVMVACYCLAFTKKHRYKFKLLSPFYWFLYMLGQIIVTGYGFTGMGELTDVKCQLKPLLFSIGFTLSNTVLLVRILINFPESERRFVRYCERNFGRTILFSIAIDVILNAAVLSQHYGSGVFFDGNTLYYKCMLESTLGWIFLILLFAYKVLILMTIAVLIFIEWNIQEFKYDIHYATATLFLSFIVYLIFGMLQYITFKSYKERFFIPGFLVYLYGVSSFGTYFFARFFSKYNEEDTQENIVKKAKGLDKKNSLEKNNSNMNIRHSDSTSIYPQKKNSMVDRIMNLHNYGDEIKKSSEILKSSTNSSSSNLSATRVNIRRSSYNSLDNIRNLEDNNNPLNRKPSQIPTIHEDIITDSFPNVNVKKSTPPPSVLRRDSAGSIEFINGRTRTRSCENFNFNINRNQRNNSIPNKGVTNFPYSNAHALSNESFQNCVNVQPINPSNSKVHITSNINSSRKGSNATEDSRIYSSISESESTEATKNNDSNVGKQ